MKNIAIIDTTLREGNQCPGVSFTKEQSVEIANVLLNTGINCIEVGHPFATKMEYERVQAIARSMSRDKVLAHARAKIEDIDAVAEAGAGWVGIFLGLNERARKTRLGGRSIEQLLEMITLAVQHAKELGLKVRYTVEDASRTDIDLIIRAFKVACEAGADRVCYSDSVGCDNPETIYQNINLIKRTIPCEMDIEVHCHNDRGLAIANSLSAIKAGAKWVSSSVNGIGERCGITDTITLMANLYYELNIDLPSPGKLKNLSRLVSGITRQFVSFQHPVVGTNAFKHTAKLHKDAVKKDIEAYAWINPEVFGEKNVVDCIGLPDDHKLLITESKIISATELKYHRHGPGFRHVLLDNRFIHDCRCYCIIREVKKVDEQTKSHVDSHRHHVDSLFLFMGDDEQMEGLNIEVMLGSKWYRVKSPASVFIPAELEHSYRFVSGSGKFVNFVLAENYNESLLEYQAVNVDDVKDCKYATV